jgi:molecular chaperone GrpE
MTTVNPSEGKPATQPEAAAPSTSAPEKPGPDDTAAAAPVDAAALAHAFESLKAENADLKDRLLRAHAEMENIRKRTEREKSEAHKYAVTRLAKDIVGVSDNFQRALESVPAEAIDQAPALKSLIEGVAMTERELLNALERHGIRRIDPKGQPFNPHQHQAVMEQPDPSVPAGTVTQVFQFGYMIEDRVLRPAMVVVAKGGARPAQPTEAATETEPVSPSAPPAGNDDTPGGATGPQP